MPTRKIAIIRSLIRVSIVVSPYDFIDINNIGLIAYGYRGKNDASIVWCIKVIIKTET